MLLEDRHPRSCHILISVIFPSFNPLFFFQTSISTYLIPTKPKIPVTFFANLLRCTPSPTFLLLQNLPSSPFFSTSLLFFSSESLIHARDAHSPIAHVKGSLGLFFSSSFLLLFLSSDPLIVLLLFRSTPSVPFPIVCRFRFRFL
jgi:hypothetical protein